MDLRSCTLLSSHRSPLDKTTAPSISVFRCYSRLFPDDSELPQVFCHVDRVNALAIPSPSACDCRRWILAVPILLDSLCVRLGQAGVLLTLLLSNRLIRGRISHHAKRPTDYMAQPRVSTTLFPLEERVSTIGWAGDQSELEYAATRTAASWPAELPRPPNMTLHDATTLWCYHAIQERLLCDVMGMAVGGAHSAHLGLRLSTW